jgi:hypothetical protein
VVNLQDGQKLVALSAEGGTNAERAVQGTFSQPTIFAIGYHPVAVKPEEEPSLKSKILKVFGFTPKKHTIFDLCDVDQTLFFQLKLGDKMAKGNIKFLGNDEASDGEQSVQNTLPRNDKGTAVPTNDDQVKESNEYV